MYAVSIIRPTGQCNSIMLVYLTLFYQCIQVLYYFALNYRVVSVVFLVYGPYHRVRRMHAASVIRLKGHYSNIMLVYIMSFCSTPTFKCCILCVLILCSVCRLPLLQSVLDARCISGRPMGQWLQSTSSFFGDD